MRLVADMIRGMNAERAHQVLKFAQQHASINLEKLLLSAVNNWQQHNEGEDTANLYVKEIFVDGGRMLKRLRPAPQGRGHRIRKRSNHVTIIIDNKN
jgi:large subunit ribosomal protein L22